MNDTLTQKDQDRGQDRESVLNSGCDTAGSTGVFRFRVEAPINLCCPVLQKRSALA